MSSTATTDTFVEEVVTSSYYLDNKLSLYNEIKPLFIDGLFEIAADKTTKLFTGYKYNIAGREKILRLNRPIEYKTLKDHGFVNEWLYYITDKPGILLSPLGLPNPIITRDDISVGSYVERYPGKYRVYSTYKTNTLLPGWVSRDGLCIIINDNQTEKWSFAAAEYNMGKILDITLFDRLNQESVNLILTPGINGLRGFNTLKSVVSSRIDEKLYIKDINIKYALDEFKKKFITADGQNKEVDLLPVKISGYYFIGPILQMGIIRWIESDRSGALTEDNNSYFKYKDWYVEVKMSGWKPDHVKIIKDFKGEAKFYPNQSPDLDLLDQKMDNPKLGGFLGLFMVTKEELMENSFTKSGITFTTTRSLYFNMLGQPEGPYLEQFSREAVTPEDIKRSSYDVKELQYLWSETQNGINVIKVINDKAPIMSFVKKDQLSIRPYYEHVLSIAEEDKKTQNPALLNIMSGIAPLSSIISEYTTNSFVRDPVYKKYIIYVHSILTGADNKQHFTDSILMLENINNLILNKTIPETGTPIVLNGELLSF